MGCVSSLGALHERKSRTPNRLEAVAPPGSLRRRWLSPTMKKRATPLYGILADMEHFALATLEAGLAEIGRSPKDQGLLKLIVRRPVENEREVLVEAALDTTSGLVGDNWSTRGSRSTPDGAAHPDMQITLMNSRVAALVTGHPDRWQIAGDQLYVDLDLSVENLPPGTRLAIGSAVIAVTDQPHRGCGKFASRFGVDALRFVNSEVGRELNLRGVNAKVLVGGVITPGDVVSKASVPRQQLADRQVAR